MDTQIYTTYIEKNNLLSHYLNIKYWDTTQDILNGGKVEYWKYNGNDCCVSVGVFNYWFGK